MISSHLITLEEGDNLNVHKILVNVPRKSGDVMINIEWKLNITMSTKQLLDLAMKCQEVINQIDKENKEWNKHNASN